MPMTRLAAVPVLVAGLALAPPAAATSGSLKVFVTGQRAGDGVVAACAAVAQPLAGAVAIWCETDTIRTVAVGIGGAAAAAASATSTLVCWSATASYPQQGTVYSSGCREL